MGSGTTDVEVICSKIIGIFCAGRISKMGDVAFSMHMDLLFLRLARRRSHAALYTILACGKDRFAQELGILLELVQWFTDSDPESLAGEWQAALDGTRRQLKLVPAEPKRRGLKRKSSMKANPVAKKHKSKPDAKPSAQQ